MVANDAPVLLVLAAVGIHSDLGMRAEEFSKPRAERIPSLNQDGTSLRLAHLDIGSVVAGDAVGRRAR